MDYEYVDNLLKYKSMSRRKLAELAGINPNTLASAFRRKSKKFPLMYILRIAKVLDVAWEIITDQREHKMAPYAHSAEEEKEIDEIFDAYEKEESDKYKKMMMVELDKLSSFGMQVAVERVQELSEIPRYRKDNGR